jgi:hypothetical protein
MRSVLSYAVPKDKHGFTTEAAIGIIMFIAVAGIIAVMVHQINQDARTDLTDGGYGENSTQESDKGIYKITSNLDLVGLAVAFGLVITIIFAAVAITNRG